jgi:hypothetical protein
MLVGYWLLALGYWLLAVSRDKLPKAKGKWLKADYSASPAPVFNGLEENSLYCRRFLKISTAM